MSASLNDVSAITCANIYLIIIFSIIWLISYKIVSIIRAKDYVS